MTHRKAKAGHLYVVATQSGTVKFGVSINPKSRVKTHHRSMGQVSPIVYEWISEPFEGYFDVEQKLVAQYGSEYLQGMTGDEIKDQIEREIGNWTPRPIATVDRVSRLVREQPKLTYRDMMQDQSRGASMGHIVQTASLIDGDETLYAHHAIHMIFGDVDTSNQFLVFQLEYLHGRLSACSPSDIRCFVKCFFKGGRSLAMMASVVDVDLSMINGLVAA